jgi:iron(III) transport system ATP-binding protein
MLAVENLKKTFRTKQETVHAIDDVSFSVESGHMLTLLGPSGCGKTSTLRCIAGLETAEAGRISIDGTALVDHDTGVFVPPNKRGMGMVFQSYAIWPHMTVYENVAYAVEGKGLSSDKVKKRVNEALARVQLDNFGPRPATRLSGGQQQRVAIARALAGQPRAILFDEPLSNLDTQLRADMRTEIRRLQQDIGMTALYVTHDQSEALAISDHIIVMRSGRIIEHGAPTQIYRRPRHVFTARFIGQSNLIAGEVRTIDTASGMALVTTAVGDLLGVDTNGDLKPGHRACVSFRPEDISTGQKQVEGPVNSLSGVALVSTFLGSIVEAQVECGPVRIKCEFDRYSQVERGASLDLTFAPRDTVVMHAEPDEAV